MKLYRRQIKAYNDIITKQVDDIPVDVEIELDYDVIITPKEVSIPDGIECPSRLKADYIPVSVKYSEDKFYDDTISVLTPNLPVASGTYHVTGTVMLTYDIIDVTSSYDPDTDSTTYNTNDAYAELNFRDSYVYELQIDKISDNID